ncbi:hypothetical protein N7G274_003103 [Stereocaulon virgatum]|uniref:Uncharacterized protein n=1 Tax=Stereocaulon virgatum TaxID=373712 RepID=A0ABR4AF51_9LECA
MLAAKSSRPPPLKHILPHEVHPPQYEPPQKISLPTTPPPHNHSTTMSSIPSLLTRPTALGMIAVAGSGAFYVGLKYRTLAGAKAQRGAGESQSGGEGPVNKEKNYEVKPGREGGGV